MRWTICHRRCEEAVRNRPAGYNTVCLCQLSLSTLLTLCHFLLFYPSSTFGRCQLVSWSRRRSLLPRCMNASWRKSKQRGNSDPCRPMWFAGEGWVRYWGTLCTHCCLFIYCICYTLNTCTLSCTWNHTSLWNVFLKLKYGAYTSLHLPDIMWQ